MRRLAEDFSLGRALRMGSISGIEFLAGDRAFGNVPCVVKLSKKTTLADEEKVDRFIHERSVLEALTEAADETERPCPFLLRFMGTLQTRRYAGFVTEFCCGSEFQMMLSSVCEFGKRLDTNRTRFYAAQIALALDHLHRLDIIHRDLKPENLVINGDGFLKIVDFGVAKRIGFKTYTLCGTPEYMAPEVVLQRGTGRPADWWGLGVFIYECVAGKAPFRGQNDWQTYHRITKGDLKFFSFMDASTRRLLKKLLTLDETRRLGYSPARGAVEVMGHPWFLGIDFDRLERKEELVPWLPFVTHALDSQFYGPVAAGETLTEFMDDVTTQVLERFVAIDEDGDGMLTVEELIQAFIEDPTLRLHLDPSTRTPLADVTVGENADALGASALKAPIGDSRRRLGVGLPESEASLEARARDLFAILDVDGNGAVDLREFLIHAGFSEEQAYDLVKNEDQRSLTQQSTLSTHTRDSTAAEQDRQQDGKILDPFASWGVC